VWPRWPVGLAFALWLLCVLGLAGIGWLDQLLRQAGRSDLVQLTTQDSPFVLAMLSAATFGAVLASRRPRHPVGWLLLAFGLSVLVEGGAYAYAHYGLLASPGAVPAASHVGMLSASGSTFIPWPACIGLVLLLTPTGTLPSPRWRWWAAVTAAVPLAHLIVSLGRQTFQYPDPPYLSVRNPLFVPALNPLGISQFPLVMIALLSVLVGGASLVVRFRRARGVERQQLRWVALAAALAGVAVPVAVAGVEIDSPAMVGWGVGGYAAVLCLAIAAAVLGS